MFVAVMEGRLRAAERAHDLAVTTGWWGAALAPTQKVPPLREVLTRKKAKTSNVAIIDTMLTMQAMGAPFQIERVTGTGRQSTARSS